MYASAQGPLILEFILLSSLGCFPLSKPSPVTVGEFLPMFLFFFVTSSSIITFIIYLFIFVLCVHPGFKDQPHRPQKTDSGLVGRQITRRHPSETSAGHLPQGESQSETAGPHLRFKRTDLQE